MGAREKLNIASVNGCLAIAAMLGILLQSWWVFGIVAIVLIAADLHSGSIRTGAGGRKSGRRS